LKDNPTAGLNVEQLVRYEVELEAAQTFQAAVADQYFKLFGETL
jgi:hypothetical protein